MKVTKSKRSLAVLLSVVMVLTAIMCVPFVSYGATTAQLETLITNYENRLNQTKRIYTNLAASYQAYYNAYTTLVSYEAGQPGYSPEAIDTVYDNLLTEYNNMTVFTGYKGTGTAAFGSAATQPSGYTNLLYADGSSDTGFSFSFKNIAGTSVVAEYGYYADFYYPATVLLYDGTTASMPVLSGLINSDGRYNVYAWRNYTDSDYFELRNNWYGYADGFVWADSDSLNSDLGDPVTLGYSTTTSGTNVLVDNKNTMRCFSNILYYTGTPTDTVTTYDSLTWYNQQDHDSKIASGTYSQTIKVINYKQLLDAVSGKKIDVTTATYESALAYCQAMDTATSLDPNSYFIGYDGTVPCKNAIESAVSGIATAYAGITSTSDFASYRTFARLYANYSAVDNTSGYYTAESFANFSTAVSNAAGILQEIGARTRRMTSAASDLATLQAAYAALEKTAEYIDDTDMQMYITEFNSLNAGNYTTASYNALQSAINAAIAACYNDGNFASGIKLLADVPADVTTYNTHLGNITTAFQNLVSTATEDDLYQETGIVTIGGPIYVHGSYTGTTPNRTSGDSSTVSHTYDFDYMMNGGTTKYVSDGTLPTHTTDSLTGEFKTEVTFPVGYSLIGITAYDEAGTELTNSSLSVVDGVLTGSFDFTGSDLATLTQADGNTTQNNYVTLKFALDDDNDGVADVTETHRVAVKQNPVATHAIVYSEGYNGTINPKIRVINYEALAVGSYGLLGDSRDASWDSESGTNANSGYVNWWFMYAPNSSEKDAYDNKVDGLTENQLSVDKVAGYYGSANKSVSSTHTVTVNSATAYYYLDLSAPTDSLPEGIGYNSSTSKYYFRIFVGNLYNSKVTDASNISCETHELTSGSNVFSASIDNTLTANNAFANNAATTGYATISFTGSVGTLTGSYKLSYYQTASNKPTGGRGIINMPFTVVVVNKSAVRTVYDNYIAMGLDSRCYTAASWATYQTALNAAENYLNNYQSNANESTLVTAMNNAYNGLELSETKSVHNFTSVVTAPTCTTTGITTYTCTRCGYSYTAFPLSALGHDWVYASNNDGSTHTKSCSRAATCGTAAASENCVDDNADGNCDLCGQSLKDPADFADFNAVKTQIEAALASAMNGTDKHSATGLNNLNTALAAASYYNYTDNQQSKVTEDYQTAVNNQTTALQAALNAFIADTDGSSVYEAFAKNVATLNADAMDIATVQAALSGVEIEAGTVTVNGVAGYPAYNFDAYIAEYQTQMNTEENYIPYTVTVITASNSTLYVVDNGDGSFSYTDDGTEATDFHYGDEITLANPNVDASSDFACSWAVSAQPQSAVSASASRHVTYANTFTFNVRGAMTITTGNSRTDGSYQIVFKQSLRGAKTDKILDVQYVNAGSPFAFTKAVLPTSVAFHTKDNAPFSVSYDNGTTTTKLSGTSFTPTGDCVVYVNYSSTNSDVYAINYTTSDDDYDYIEAAFNESVTLTDDNAVAFVTYVDDDPEGEIKSVLCYGTSYTFFAYQDMDIYAVSSIDEVVSVSVCSAPIIDRKNNNKTYLVGGFALPDDCTVQSYGFVMNAYEPEPEHLSLADLVNDGEDLIVNLTSSNCTNVGQRGNQFSVKFNSVAMYNPSYVAYVIYTDGNGDTQYAYSEIIMNADFS